MNNFKQELLDYRYWQERLQNTVFNVPERDTPVALDDQVKILKAIQEAFEPYLEGKALKVEVYGSNKDVRFKIRRAFNPFLENTRDLNRYVLFLSRIRDRLNTLGKEFKTCKVFLLSYDIVDPNMTSFNVVVNPSWRRYENYEILFRSKTQLKRSFKQ